MKYLKLSIITAFILSGIIACKKGTIASLNVSNDDAASILAGSMASNSYGVTNISSDISLNALNSITTNLSCGLTKTDTIIRKNAAGATATYNYKLIYSNKLNCNTSNLPDNIISKLTYTGNYSNQKLSLTNSGNNYCTIAGLTPTATVHVVNGEYKSMGTFKLKADSTNRGSANVDIVVKNLTINKSTQVIAGGTATVIVTGTTVKKGDFTYNGTLTFNGNNMTTMSLNGTTYIINLATGDIVKK